MYSEFFGLRTLPFEDRADTQFYFATPEIEEALASLLYELHHGSGLGFVTGEAGTGKTMLIRTLLTRLDKIDQVTVLTWSAQNRTDVIREACKGFGVTLPSSHNHARRLNRLRRHLTRAAESNQRSILIVDQAENLSADNVAQVAALVDLEGAAGRLLKIVLVAQPQIQSTLERTQFARIRQQLFGERRIGVLSPEATRAYVEHRLHVAGVSEACIFDHGAHDRIVEISQGVPRLINRVCNASLLAAYGAGLTEVTAGLVAEAAGQQALRERSTTFEDLGLSSSPYRTAPWVRPNPGRGQEATRIEVRDVDTPPAELPYEVDPFDSTPITAPEPAAIPTEELNMYTTANSQERSTGAADRLERAISKAERLAATTEASLTQLTAIEKHIASLLDRADALSTGFAPIVERGVASIEQSQRKLADSMQRADQRAASFHSQTARVTEWTQRIDDLLAQVERTTSTASGLENRLKETTTALADKADDIQNRITDLTTVLSDSARVQSQADQTVTRMREMAAAELTAFQSAVQLELSKQKAGVAATIEAALQKCALREQAVVQATEGSARELNTLRTVLSAEMESLRQQWESREQSAQRATTQAAQLLDRAVADAIDKAQVQLDAILKHASSTRTETEDRIAGQVERLSAALSDAKTFEAQFVRTTIENARRDWRELVESAGGQLDGLQTKLDNAVGQKRTLDQALETATDQSTSVGKDLSNYSAALTEKVRALADLERRTEALQPTVQALCRAETVIAGIKETETRIGTMTVEVASAVADAERSADRAAEACKHIAEVEQILARTRLDRAAAQEATLALRTATDEAIQAHQGIVRISDDAESLRTGLVQSTSDARTASNELRTSLQGANAAIEQASQTIHAAREESRLAREQSERLTSIQARAATLHGELTTTARAAENRHETLHGLVLHAEEKIHRLGSHHAAASSILDRLAAGTSTGHQLVERLAKAKSDAGDNLAEAETKVDRLVQDVWSLTTQTETLAKELSRQHDEAQTERKALIEAATVGSETGKLLSSASMSAEAVVTALAERQDRAERALGRLSGLAEALASASQMQTTLGESVAKAEQLSRGLAELAEQTEPRCAALREANEETRALAETLQEAREETRTTAQRLAAVVSAHAERLAQADTITDEAMARVERMRDELNVVAAKLDGFSRDLNAAADQPKSMLDAVQTQTQQLEQVCIAVRKVFASLSQATLEARQQTDELKTTGTELGQRWSQLASETTRAGKTLHEWVEEAVRAQARLERTLNDTPSIHTTHPTSAVSAVADILERITGNATAEEPPTDTHSRIETTVPSYGLANQLTRAEQISQLIAEAKLAESAVA